MLKTKQNKITLAKAADESRCANRKFPPGT